MNAKILMFLPLVLSVGACNSSTNPKPLVLLANQKLTTRGVEIEPGIWRAEVRLPVSGDAPRAWVYRSTATLAAGTKAHVPCIFIAPAGTEVTSGAPLNDDERDTHIPYAQAGMIVVAYEINGLSDDKAVAARDFKNAHMGLVNAQGAVTWALQHVPGIDPKRLYAIGHSSAGTLALQLAQHDQRIRAGVGYAPACNFAWPDPGGSVLDIAAVQNKPVPGFSMYLRRMMPQSNVALVHCPLFLFSCDDDKVVNPREVRGFVAALQKAGKNVTFLHQPQGGHVNGMKQNGIPSAIQWLKRF